MSRLQKLEYIKLLFDTFCITWLLWPLLWLVTSRSSCSSIAMSLPRLEQNLSVYLGVIILTAVLSLPLSQLPLLPYIYILSPTLCLSKVIVTPYLPIHSLFVSRCLTATRLSMLILTSCVCLLGII